MFKKIVVILIFFAIFHSSFVLADSSSQAWIGEWGNWKKIKTDKYEGQNISIFEKNNKIQGVIEFHKGDSFDTIVGELSFISPTEAKFLQDSEAYKVYSGELHLLLENTQNSHKIIAKVTGDWPKILATSYDFHTNHLYPDSKTRILSGSNPNSYKSACYTDKDPGILLWCNSPEISSFEARVYESINNTEQDDFNAALSLDIWREDMLKKCRYQKDFLSCYKNEFSTLETKNNNIVSERKNRYAEIQKPGDPNKAAELIDKIDGVYKTSHIYHPIDGGAAETLENILEIVKVSAGSIYYRLSTNYGNAHGCEMHGIAIYKQNGSFLYNDKGDNYREKTCFLQITPSLKGITLKEADDEQACQAYCSVIEGNPNEFFAADRRRTIRYMGRLKNSDEYKSSISKLEDQKEQ